MSKTSFLLWPVIAVLVVSMFFIGLYVAPQKSSIQNVEAADTMIYFSTSDSETGLLYEDMSYANPDYCSKVMVVIRSLNNDLIMAANIFTFSGDCTATTFSLSGAFVVNTWYKLETAVPTFAKLQISELNNIDYGVFQYTANKTFHFTYEITDDRWFSGMATI